MLLELLAKHWKNVAVLCLMLACFAAGEFHARKSMGAAEVVQKTTENDKTVATVDVQKEEKTNLKTVVVKKPDGTTVTTTTENTDTTTATKSKTVATETKTSKTDTKSADAILPKYRAGVFAGRALPDLLDKPLQKPDYGVQAAYRVIGPVWVDTTYNFSNKELTLGASVEF
jgi:hypothetical protein